MFARILVPLDLSQKNERALATALELARQSRAEVVLLHVIERIEGVPVAELRGFYRRLELRAQRMLERASRRFTRSRIAVRAVVMTGNPSHEIVRFAAASRIHLIVLTSHRVAPGRRGRGWGTTSYKVGILCSCPVMLVK